MSVSLMSGRERFAPDMTVLVQGDRITEVRPSKNNESLSAKDIQVIDGRGKFLLPGLWDMHVHSAGDDRALHLFIAYGITGIRDMAGDAAKLADARRRITSGELTGPRLVFAIFSEFRELVRSIRQNHVSILAGTDSSSVLKEKGDPPGTSLHDELALLVDAGFTPSEALVQRP
jgi:imidazolonepropionase-like amidohydrolase